jgi:uncharacterized membrane protein
MSRALLALTFLTTGALHFLRPRAFEAIVPRYLPAHRALVYASGAAEIGGGTLWARLPLQGALIAWVWRVAGR